MSNLLKFGMIVGADKSLFYTSVTQEQVRELIGVEVSSLVVGYGDTKLAALVDVVRQLESLERGESQEDFMDSFGKFAEEHAFVFPVVKEDE